VEVVEANRTFVPLVVLYADWNPHHLVASWQHSYLARCGGGPLCGGGLGGSCEGSASASLSLSRACGLLLTSSWSDSLDSLEVSDRMLHAPRRPTTTVSTRQLVIEGWFT
jgi:hypothetical protein